MTPPAPRTSLDQVLQQGVASHRAGDLPAAEKIYREVLRHQPSHPDALHLLGLVAHQSGNAQAAIELIRRAIAANPGAADFYHNLGQILAENGNLREAIPVYEQALRLAPQSPEMLNNLGVALCKVGSLNESVAALRQAVGLKPDYSEAHNNLGVALRDFGSLDEAHAAFEKAIELNPRNAEALNNLGMTLRARDRFDDAMAALRRAITLKPDFAQAYNNLGNVLRDKGELDDSVAALFTAISLLPNFGEAHNNLGAALRDKKLLEESIASFGRAIALMPNSADAHYNLAGVLFEARRPDEAIAAYVRAIALRPAHAQTYFNLANVLRECGRTDESAEAYRRAIAAKPDYAEAFINLGVLMRDTGRLEDSIACYRAALGASPKFAEAHINLGVSLCDVGLHDESLVELRRGLSLGHEMPEALGALIFILHYQEHPEAQQRTAEWSWRYAEPLARLIPQHANDRAPGRRLRIGFVSPDLRAHPVGTFLFPLLAQHDKSQVESFCYASVPRPDAITRRLQAKADHWRDIYSLGDQAAAELISHDQIDILIDLAGHTSHNRLLVFARKPAPVQASWLGYPDITGLATIDYRLTDAHADPPRENESSGPERLIRLPDAAWCFQPPLENLPAPGERDASRPITFGSFNNFSKVTGEILDRWAQILLAVDGARLLICAKALDSPGTVQRIQQHMESAGISPDRLLLLGWQKTFAGHLASYQQADIVLDTFPYHGTTITCEAMWMGVPVITQAGQSHVSRVGVSLLNCVGLADLIAASADDYVRKAIELARDSARLNTLRGELRVRMEQSPLMDAPRFARNMESAYRRMWMEIFAK